MAEARLNGYYGAPPIASEHIRTYLLQEEVQKLYQAPPDKDHFYAQNRVQKAILPNDYHSASQAANRIVRNFQTNISTYSYGENVALTTLDVISGTMQGALQYAAVATAPISPPASVALIATSLVASTGTNMLKDTMQKNRFEGAKNKLAIDLANYRKKYGNFEAFDFNSDENIGRKRFDLLYNADHPVLNPAFDHIPDEGKALVQGTMIKMLADGQVTQANNERLLFNPPG